MNEIVKVFNGNPVRIIERDGNPWFGAKDVCRILKLGNPRSSLALLDADEKGVHKMDTLGGEQEMTVVSEAGLYSLILRSRKPEAKAFKRWITHEVLPSIRKTGGYIAPNLSTKDMEALTVTLVEEIDRRVHGEYEIKRLQGVIKTLSEYAIPKKLIGAISDATGLPRNILVGSYLRSDSRKHKSSKEKYVQLLLPFVSRECQLEQLPCLRNARHRQCLEA